ncbi:MAG: hypothetical protein ACFFEF_09750 [Candidatus Thorarchaeota archaeon]
MTGDSDFTDYADDERTYSAYSEADSIKSEYRARARKYSIIGVALLLSPLSIFIVAISPLGGLADLAVILTLGVSLLLAIIGVILLIYHGVGSSVLITGFEKLEQLSPPVPVLVGRYVVVQVKDVYLLAHGLSGHLYAIAFRGSPQSVQTSKAKLPRIFYRWEKRIDIDNLSMFRREGIFIIPTPLGDYLEGDAILYGAPYMPSRYDWSVPDFTRDQLLAIVDSILEDAARLY